MQSLSPMQSKVFSLLRAHYLRTGRPPELPRLAKELGIHYVSLRQHLRALHAKGQLRFESRGRGQTPLLALPAQATGVPVVGDVTAGPLSEALAHPEGYLTVPGSETLFALRVRGDSMADAIQDGDIVLLERSKSPRSGDICAVRDEDGETTLKQLRIGTAREVTLRPLNPAYQELKLEAERLVVEGVVVGLLRGRASQLLFEAA